MSGPEAGPTQSETVVIDDLLGRVGGLAGLRDAFTSEELDVLSTTGDPLPGLAARYLAKRLVIEVLSGEPRPELGAEHMADLRAVVVMADGSGRPVAKLGRPLLSLMGSARLHLSMSHDGGLAAASVVLD